MYTIQYQAFDGETQSRAVRVNLAGPFSPIGPWSPIKGKAEFDVATAERADRWVPGAGGNETPITTRTRKTWLWCFNPGQCRHAYIDLGTDMEVGQHEALYELGGGGA